MSGFAERFARLIAAEGPQPVARFMAEAVAHYYANRDPFGTAGDFVTAPEVSQMFGELIGLWAADLWDRAGRPAPLRLVELGPGRGTLMRDAWRAVAKALPGFADAASVHLVETSPALTAQQRETLEGLPAAWHTDLDGVPPGFAIIVANEFFDALPIRQFVRGGQGWHERLVGLDAGGVLAFALSPPVPGIDLPEAPEGSMLEASPARSAYAARIAGRLAEQGGAALLIDYGHAASGIGDTLQALKAHRFVDVLRDAGEADLTAHVDFAALARAARAAGARVAGPAGQGEFLLGLGLAARAERLKASRPAEAAGIDAAVARLTGTEAMGSLFLVMALLSPRCPPPAGLPPAS